MNNTVLSALWSILRLSILVAFIVLIKIFIVDVYSVVGPSMEPSMIDGSSIAGIKYEKTYVQGDVVLYKRPGRSEIQIGRIVALPGDTIRIEDGEYYQNDEIADEPYLDGEIVTDVSENGYVKDGVAITIPPNQFFIMGDNRERSIDSRDWGLLPEENIEAKYLRCVIRC